VLARWTKALSRAGIRRFEGDIIADDSRWGTQPLPGGWIWEDIGNYYGAGTWGLNWHENQYDLRMKPGRAEGDSVRLVLPGEELEILSWINELRTGAPGSGDNAFIYLPPYSFNAFVRGTVPLQKEDFVIAGSIPNKRITVIDLDQEAIAFEIKLDKGVRPMAIESNPDGSPRRIFAQLSELNGFAVVDFAERREVARITLPRATMTFETDPGRDTSPAHGIGVAPDGKTLWVTSIPNNAVFVYSLADLKQIGEVALPVLKLPGREPISSVPNWVTFTPNSDTVYVSNAGLRSVTAIDTASMTVKAVIPVGEVPKRINTLVTN